MLTTYKNNLKEHLLVDLHKFLVPLINVCRLLTRIGIIVVCGRWVTLVVNAPFDDLVQDGLVDLACSDQLCEVQRGHREGSH